MKKIIFICISVFFVFSIMAFEWPVKDFDSTDLKNTFAQYRKKYFNSSQIFPEAQEVVATDKGKVTMVILEHQGDGEWFESTLGNCVIIAHEDNLISAYGNLNAEEAQKFCKHTSVVSGESLGIAQNSAWSEDEGALEFQIIDTSEKVFLNPLILMPRVASMQDPALDGLTLENRFGRTYELSSTHSVQAGMYTVFKNRRENYPVHESSVYLNGSELEKITKDTLTQIDGKLSISAQRPYTSEEFYPDNSRELLGRIVIPHGANNLTITVQNSLQNERTATYNIQGF